MLDRRTLLALTAAFPMANHFPRLDVPDLRVDAMELEDGDNVQILGISPDASTLVGIKNREQMCFYSYDIDTPIHETVSAELISISDPVAEIKVIDNLSVTWNPASTKVAFSVDAFLLGRDSDIFVVDVATGEVTNLTGEGTEEEAESLFTATDIQIDMYPHWLDDESIVFARHAWKEANDVITSLVTMNINETEVTTWAELNSPDIRFIMKSAKLLPDGRFVFAADSADNRIRLFTASEGEAPQQIDIGEIGFFQLIDANGTHALLQEVETFVTWRVSYDGSDEIQDTNDFFEFPDDEPALSLPFLGPTPGSLVIAQNNKNRSIMVYEDDNVREIAYLRGPESSIHQIVWVPNRVLIAGRNTSWLIPHES